MNLLQRCSFVCLQEPENDPRLCCYLWVARGQTGDEDVEDMATTTITLYQLIYERKENLPGYGRVLKVSIFQEIVSIGEWEDLLRFDGCH